MRKIALIVLSFLFFVACEKTVTVEQPIKGDNINDLFKEIETQCMSYDKTLCEHVWALIRMSLPDAKNSSYVVKDHEKATAELLYEQLSNKTTRELTLMYKGDMMNAIQKDMEKNSQISAQLDDILKNYQKNKRGARQFPIANPELVLNPSSISIMLTINNHSRNSIKQLTGYVNIYDNKSELVFKSEDFVLYFEPKFVLYDRYTLFVDIAPVSPEDIVLLKNNKRSKIEVILKTMVTGDNKVLLFELPESYSRMKSLLLRSTDLNKERISLIESINTEEY